MKMLRKLLVASLAITLLISVFLFGFFIGFIRGFNNGEMLEMTGQSLLTVYELRRLREGNVNKAIRFLEDRLNAQILNHGRYLERGNHFMVDLYYKLNPILTVNADTATSMMMGNVANYRKEYPIFLEPIELVEEASEADIQEEKNRVNEENQKIKEILSKYGWEVSEQK